jgi:undecaprenyl-diphosphatase
LSELSVANAVILGVLQGLTEFLPVSSSGHLLLARELLDISLPGLSFEVMLHVGTALAVVVVLRREIASILRSLLRWERARPGFDLAWRIVLASVPAVLAAGLLGSFIQTRLAVPRVAAAMLLVTAAMLMFGTRGIRSPRTAAARRGRRQPAPSTRSRYPVRSDVPAPASALWIGIAQAVAIVPGISRSGSTVVAGLRCGLSRDAAARFSLLLSLPVIFGGAVLDGVGLLREGTMLLAWAPALAGVAAAFVSGLASASLLLAVVRRAKLGWFGLYCAVAGIIGLWLTR